MLQDVRLSSYVPTYYTLSIHSSFKDHLVGKLGRYKVHFAVPSANQG